MAFKLLVCDARKAIDRKEKEGLLGYLLEFYFLAEGAGTTGDPTLGR